MKLFIVLRYAEILSKGSLLFHFSGFSLDYKDDSVEALLDVREKLSNPDHSVLYKTCSELTKVNYFKSPKILILPKKTSQVSTSFLSENETDSLSLSTPCVLCFRSSVSVCPSSS